MNALCHLKGPEVVQGCPRLSKVVQAKTYVYAASKCFKATYIWVSYLLDNLDNLLKKKERKNNIHMGTREQDEQSKKAIYNSRLSRLSRLSKVTNLRHLRRWV